MNKFQINVIVGVTLGAVALVFAVLAIPMFWYVK